MTKERAFERKALVGLIALLFVFVFVLSVVHAAPTTQPTSQPTTQPSSDELANAAANTVTNSASSFWSGAKEYTLHFLDPMFGEKEMLTRIFFFILLYMLLYNLVGVMFHGLTAGSRLVTIVATFIIAVLAMWALPANFLEAIRTQYGAMGAAFLSIIPFAIMLIFTVRVQNALLARLVWIFFAMYYFALYAYQVVIAGGGWVTAETIPYLLAMVVGLFLFFGIGVIRNALFKGEMSALKESGNQVAEKAMLLHKLQDKELKASYGEGNK